MSTSFAIKAGVGPLGYAAVDTAPQSSALTAGAIKAAIARADTSQTAIAEHLGVHVNSVSRVINGAMRSAKIEAELAKITGKAIHPGKPVKGRKKTTWSGAQAGAAA